MSRPAAGGPDPDDSLVTARHQLTDAVEELVAVLRARTSCGRSATIDRANLAKYLTIAKLKLENAIAIVRYLARLVRSMSLIDCTASGVRRAPTS